MLRLSTRVRLAGSLAPGAGFTEMTGASKRHRAIVGALLAFSLLSSGCSGIFPSRAAATASAPSSDPSSKSYVTPITRRAPAAAPVAAPELPVFLPAAPLLLNLAPATVIRTAPPPEVAPVVAFVAPVPEPVIEPVMPANPVLGALASPTPVNPPAGSILPAGIFAKTAGAAAQPLSASVSVPSALPGPLGPVETSLAPVTPARARQVKIWVYVSPTTLNYFSALGVDYQNNIYVWQDFLGRHDLPFEVVGSLDSVRRAPPGDVLVLPTAVALTDAEKATITSFRNAGGSVLSSWLSGVRSELGAWRGLGFMQTTLGVSVAGNTETETDDTFLTPHGDNPVTHSVPAGLRIWLERVPEWLPLRLSGARPAADIFDWSRNVRAGRPSSLIAFDEGVAAGGRPSRVVVLGFPERLWLSAQRELFEPVILDAMNWLTRRPDAYASAWPWPYRSALVLAIDAADTLTDSVNRYAQLAEDLGGRSTVFVMSEHAASSAEMIKKLQARGHEIAYLGDRFDTFKDQPASAQGRRFDAMAVEMRSAGIEVVGPPGFHAPMEGYDEVTERLLRERGFGHFIGHPGASDTRLPFIATGAGTALPTVGLPRTQNSPDDALAEAEAAVPEAPAGTPAAIVQASMAAAATAGLNNFLEEFDRVEKMGGLSIVRLPTQSEVSDPQWEIISRRAKLNRAVTWTATAGQVANWWRDRERVRVTLDTNVTPPLLTLELSGDSPLIQPLSVLVNLPQAGAGLRLIADAARTAAPKVASYDTWRAALIFENLAPGTHRWFLDFDRAGAAR